ncbi:MAG TPA: hypothetical protein VG184_13075, partial [Acidimicrobiales bacterium]|nr:hypothetical protein [Acidimicrobiales bacterium]
MSADSSEGDPLGSFVGGFNYHLRWATPQTRMARLDVFLDRVVVRPRSGRRGFFVPTWEAGPTDRAVWRSSGVSRCDSTRQLYTSLIKRHLKPTFERVPLTDISTASVRRWHAGIAKKQPTTGAKAYRLLRAVLMTATADGIIQANPCIIKGAGLERAPVRKVPTLETLAAIADALDDRYRALVYTA